MMTHQDYIDLAIAMACENVAKEMGGPFGAVIVRHGQVIAKCANEVTRTHDPTAHAEIVAIRNACHQLQQFELDDCELYTSCEPCPMCLSAIYWARIPKVYFAANQMDAKHAGFDDHWIYQEIGKPLDKRNVEMSFLDAPNKNEPFLLWSQSEGSIRY
ncbi:MAG: nucleoside deaminase [Bdellovibrionota bacterium]